MINNKNIKIAVVGCGRWGKNLTRVFFELGALKAVCDPHHGDIYAEKYDVPNQAYTDILSDQDIQAVVIATPAPSHAQLVKQALFAGKDVFVEKPFTLTVEEGESLCQIAKERQRILMVGHIINYHPAYCALQDLVQSGALGKIHYIKSSRYNLGVFRSNENAMWCLAPHDISIVLNVTKQFPSQITSIQSDHVQNGIEDFSTIHLKHKDGLQAEISVSWFYPYKKQELIVVGDEGMVIFDDVKDWDKKLAFYKHKIDRSSDEPQPIKADVEYVKLTQKEPLKEECLHLLNAVATRENPKTDGLEGLKVTYILENAMQSSADKTTIALEKTDKDFQAA